MRNTALATMWLVCVTSRAILCWPVIMTMTRTRTMLLHCIHVE